MDHDILSISDYIRFWLGGLSESDVPQTVLSRIVQMVIDRDATYTECDVIYHSTIDLLGYLIRQGAKGNAGSAGSGAISSRREKVGNTDIEITYDVGTSGGVTSSWQSVLDDLKSDPNSIGCTVSQDSTPIAVKDLGVPHFGGVSQKEYDRVNNDTDSKNGWSISTPYRKRY